MLVVIYYFLMFYLQMGTKTHFTWQKNNWTYSQDLRGSLWITKKL